MPSRHSPVTSNAGVDIDHAAVTDVASRRGVGVVVELRQATGVVTPPAA